MTPPTRHNHHNTRVSTLSRRRRVPTESAASNEMPCSAIRAPTAHERAGTRRSRLDLATRLDRTPKTVKHNLMSQLTNADFSLYRISQSQLVLGFWAKPGARGPSDQLGQCASAADAMIPTRSGI